MHTIVWTKLRHDEVNNRRSCIGLNCEIDVLPFSPRQFVTTIRDTFNPYPLRMDERTTQNTISIKGARANMIIFFGGASVDCTEKLEEIVIHIQQRAFDPRFAYQ
ncbi:TPA: hypothetical protein MH262_18575 [Klebsiella pneumoniae]|nr:hypothetical protein [Klebsiella pneumoniae]